MRYKLSLLGALLGVFLLALGATLRWHADARAAPAADATPVVVTVIPVGSNPSGVAVNPTTNRIYTANWNAYGHSGDVSVIDGGTNTEIDTDGNPANGITRIAVGHAPRGVAVNPTANRVYTANAGSSTVSVIDSGTNTVVATVPVDAAYPVGVAVNSTTNGIYTANQSSASVSVIQAFPAPVGGIAELPELAGAHPNPSNSPGHDAGFLAALAAAGAAGTVVLGAAAWHARTRWLKP